MTALCLQGRHSFIVESHYHGLRAQNMTSLRSFRPGDTTPWPSHIALKQSRSSGRTWKVVNAAQSPTLLGQAVLEAGLQAFERVGRSFQPLPAGFPPGVSSIPPVQLLATSACGLSK